nr:glutathione synthetase, chloroplastic [Tanacetum cinerariifolium]
MLSDETLQVFLDNKNDIAKLRECFVGFWRLDDTEAVKNVVEQQEAYVMKPQREGGDWLLQLLLQEDYYM